MDADFPVELKDDVRKFFQHDVARPAGLSVYDDVYDNAGCMFPLQRKRETAYMMQTARRITPQVVMEIGADKGGGFYHWCKSLLSVRRAIACEVRGTPYAEEFKHNFPNIDFLFLPKSSYAMSTVAEVAEWLGGDKIDCLFIDGDKSQFYLDYTLYSPFIRKGGLLFVHDIRDPGPREAWIKMKGQHVHREFIDESEAHEACEREKQGVASISQHENWLRHWRGQSAGVGVLFL